MLTSESTRNPQTRSRAVAGWANRPDSALWRRLRPRRPTRKRVYPQQGPCGLDFWLYGAVSSNPQTRALTGQPFGCGCPALAGWRLRLGSTLGGR
jgi:hypothetical protein